MPNLPNPPVAVQALGINAAELRALISATFPKPGILGTGVTCTQTSTPSMAVVVKPLIAVVQLTANAAPSCRMVVPVNADTTVPLASPPSSGSRTDLIVARVYDSAFTVGVTDRATLEVVNGAVPDGAELIATVTVNAGVTGITTGDIVPAPTSTVALGGSITTALASLPAATAVPAGTSAVLSDQRCMLVESGGAWVPVGPRAVVKVADESVTSSTTMQNDDHLLIGLTPGLWRVECHIHASGDPASDIKVGWVFTGSYATAYRSSLGPASTATSGDASDVMTRNYGLTVAPAFGLTSGQTVTIQEDVLIEVTATGNLRLQWAQAASGGTATQVRIGSRLFATRVAN